MNKKIETKLGLLELDQVIGDGKYRVCYSVKGRKDIVIKVLKKPKTLLKKLRILFLGNMNLNEERIYRKLPEDVKEYFNPVLDASRDYIVVSRPVDYNGEFSKSAFDHEKVENENFWLESEKLLQALKKNKLWLFDLFGVKNVFVIKKTMDTWVPFITDYKRSHGFFYFHHINLILKSEKEKKLDRKLEKLKRKRKKQYDF